MALTEAAVELYTKTAQALTGSARRLFMARTVKALGRGGKEQARRELGWSGTTIRKGLRELETGITCADACNARGRKRAEEKLPNLLVDIRAIVEGQSQTDASFKTTHLYTRLSAAEVRRQLITEKHYTEEELPCEEVIRQRLNQLDYRVRAVRKSTPQKKLPKPTRSLSRSSA
jgi:hypothetical protein